MKHLTTVEAAYNDTLLIAKLWVGPSCTYVIIGYNDTLDIRTDFSQSRRCRYKRLRLYNQDAVRSIGPNLKESSDFDESFSRAADRSTLFLFENVRSLLQYLESYQT